MRAAPQRVPSDVIAPQVSRPVSRYLVSVRVRGLAEEAAARAAEIDLALLVEPGMDGIPERLIDDAQLGLVDADRLRRPSVEITTATVELPIEDFANR